MNTKTSRFAFLNLHPGDEGAEGGDGSGGSGSEGSKKIELTEEELQNKIDDNSAKVRQTTERKMKKELDDLAAQLQQIKDDQEREKELAKGEHEALYKKEVEKTSALTTEVKNLKTLLEARTGALHSHVDSLISDWPEEIKSLDPGSDGDLEARLEWVGKAKVVADKLKGGPAPKGEHGEGQKPDSSGGDKSTGVDAAIAAVNKSQTGTWRPGK